MANTITDHNQIVDLFAIAGSQRFTGSMMFHFSDGQAKDVEILWKLTFGDKVMRFIRIMRGRPPPGDVPPRTEQAGAAAPQRRQLAAPFVEAR